MKEALIGLAALPFLACMRLESRRGRPAGSLRCRAGSKGIALAAEPMPLSDAQMHEVAGGQGDGSGSFAARVTFNFTDTASGTTAAVSGTLSITTTASSASLSGSFSSSSA
jgi:hypothetical protein